MTIPTACRAQRIEKEWRVCTERKWRANFPVWRIQLHSFRFWQAKTKLEQSLIGRTLDHIFPRRLGFWHTIAAKLIFPKLEMSNVRLTPAMSSAVVWAPARDNVPAMSALELPLSIVTHGVRWLCLKTRSEA